MRPRSKEEKKWKENQEEKRRARKEAAMMAIERRQKRKGEIGEKGWVKRMQERRDRNEAAEGRFCTVLLAAVASWLVSQHF